MVRLARMATLLTGEMEPVATQAPHRVGDVMHEPVLQLPVGGRALEARRLMQAQDIRHIAIVNDKGVAVGVVSDRDLRAAGPSRFSLTDDRAREKALAVIPLADVMSQPAVSVSEGTPLAIAVRLMLRRRIGCLLVTDATGRPIGIVTTSDVMRVALGALAREAGDSPQGHGE